MAPSSYVAGLLPRIRSILGRSDLSTISAKAVRKRLISDGQDADTIKQYRNEIDDEIGKIYDRLCAADRSSPETPLGRTTNQASASTSTSQTTPRQQTQTQPTTTSHIPQSSPPEPLSKPKIKQERKPKPEAVSEEESPENDSEAESDGAIARRLQREFDALDGQINGARRRTTRPGNARPVKKVKKKTVSQKRVRGDDGEEDEGSGGEEKKKRRGGGGGAFNKELLLSDALTALLNTPRLSRPQVVKQIWDHIKANDLQDPRDKRMILCDDPMRAVFHTDRLHMFTMNKLLVAHLRDPDLVVQPSGHRDAKSAVVVPAVDVKAIAPPGEPTYVSDESGEEGY